MRPRERRESGKQDLFRSRLDQIIDMNHALVKLARAIDWHFLEETFGAAQYFCGEEFFQHALVFDRSSLTRWRQRMGGREAYGDAAGKPGGGDPDASDEAVREIGVEGPESPPRI